MRAIGPLCGRITPIGPTSGSKNAQRWGRAIGPLCGRIAPIAPTAGSKMTIMHEGDRLRVMDNRPIALHNPFGL